MRGYFSSHRYSVGLTFLKVATAKASFTCYLAAFWFINLVNILRFMQVVVWKRVVEINEDLVNFGVIISMALICFTIGWLVALTKRFYLHLSTFSGVKVEVPLESCIDSPYPFEAWLANLTLLSNLIFKFP